MSPPLVLLPGMNCSGRLWAGVLERVSLPLSDVFVEQLDQPDLTHQVDVLLDRLPLHFALGGLSLGAITAMAIHRRAPERVLGLYLVATNARAPTPQQCDGWRAQLHRLASGDTARALQQDLLPLLLGQDPPHDVLEETLVMADEVGQDQLSAQLRLQLTRVDERPGLKTAKVPCSIVAAGDDALCPLDRHLEIHRLVRGSRLVVLPNTPHLSSLVDPTAVASTMDAWLEDVRRGRGFDPGP